MGTLDRTVTFLELAIVVALPFLLFNFLRYLIRHYVCEWKGQECSWRTGFPFKSVLALAGPILILSLLTSIATRNLRNGVHEFLAHASTKAVVRIDNKIVRNPQSIIRELQSISPEPQHRGSFSRTIHVLIEDRGKRMEFVLRRDSRQVYDYRVSCPHYKTAFLNEIGSVTTDVFDWYQ